MARTKLKDRSIPQRDTLVNSAHSSRAERRETRKAVDRKLAGRSMTSKQNRLADTWLMRNHPGRDWSELRKDGA